jgi:hypothetical protein
VNKQIAGRRNCKSPRVIASVLEGFQRGENRFANVALLANVAENAAHAIPSLAGTPAKRIASRRLSPSGCAVIDADKRWECRDLK